MQRCGRRCGAAAALKFRNLELGVDTHKAALEYGVGVVDITGLVCDAAAASGVRNGLVTVVSKHTTTAVCVNENESRLFSDIQARLKPSEAVARQCGIRAPLTWRYRAPPRPPNRRFCCSLRRRCPKRGTGITISSSGAPWRRRRHTLCVCFFSLPSASRAVAPGVCSYAPAPPAASRRRTGRVTWLSGELRSPSTRTPTSRLCSSAPASRCRSSTASSRSAPGRACSCWSSTDRGSVALAFTSWANDGTAAGNQLFSRLRSVCVLPVDDQVPSA